MSDDSKIIADTLINELGVEGAKRIAMEAADEMNRLGNNYELSIWRDVKRVLSECEEPE